VPIGFHPTGTTALRDDAGRRFVGHANFHPIAHAIRNPVELMGAIASLTTGGVLERHPKLRAAFLEGTAGWLYWWLWRLDDQWEKFGPGCDSDRGSPACEGPFSSHVTRRWRRESAANSSLKFHIPC
jgi:hypothetical protein